MNNLKFNASSYLLLLLLIAVDFLSLYLSFTTARFFHDADIDISIHLWIFVLIIFSFASGKIYVIRYDFWGDAKKMLKGIFFSFFAVFTVISLAKISGGYSESFLLKFFIIAVFFTLFLKRVFKKIIFLFDFFKIKVRVVADDENYKTITSEIRKNWYFGYEISDEEYDTVIISSRGFDISFLQESISDFSHNTKDIYIIPYLDNLNFTHTTIVDFSNIRFSALHIENRLLNYKNILVKYLFEKVVVVMLFPFAIVLHLFIRHLIKKDSSGDIFFVQERLGKDFITFKCYKYRTMYEGSGHILDEYLLANPDEIEYFEKYHKYKNDPRITKIGHFLRKTSLDELPQFFNILKGEMNLIGPRPYMVDELQKIDKNTQEAILKVKPGLTGLWQVSGRSELTFKKRLELDLWYIQNWSLWMDFVIFLKTIKVVFFKVGAK